MTGRLMLSLWRFATILMVIFFIWAFFFIGTNSFAAETIKIGVGLDLTGPLSLFGDNIYHSMKIAKDEINSNGGVIGKKLEFIVFDTKSKSEVNVQLRNLQAALYEVKIDYLIGPFGLRYGGPGFNAAEKNIIHEHKIPTIIFKSFFPYPQPHRYIFQISPDIFMYSYAVSEWIEKDKKLKNYVVIGPGDSNLIFLKSIQRTRPDLKKIDEIHPNYGTTDFAPEIRRIAAMKPDIIISTLTGPSLKIFLKQSIDQKLYQNIKLIGNLNTVLLKQMGSDMIENLNGFASAPFYALNTSCIDGLIKKFKGQKIPYPIDAAVIAYDAVKILAQAIERAGSTEREKVLDEFIKGGFDSLRGRLDENVPIFIGKTSQDKIFFEKHKFYPMNNIQLKNIDDCNDEKCRCDDGSCKRACCEE